MADTRSRLLRIADEVDHAASLLYRAMQKAEGLEAVELAAELRQSWATARAGESRARKAASLLAPRSTPPRPPGMAVES